ncbi:MAG: excinuclease ABC subunit UvrA [Candidatus Aminicenantes bacterium]|nr:excinuclease ABC subunit UvrA [Candidatus Aminicenantes bacterium]
MTTDKNKIILKGVRVHNLKNIDLEIPLNQQIIVTGVSGSGKSSLAFDTLYAEGQRRFIESLSAYARQFLERMEKPDADSIEGITPAIAIQQKAVTKNPRSTVATVTEIYDFLRVLYARIGIIHCLQCGKPVYRDTIDAMVEVLYKHDPKTRVTISFPWSLEKGVDLLKQEGFHRVLQEETVLPLEKIDLSEIESLEVFMDRLALDREDRERLVDSLETALMKGEGRLTVRTDGGQKYAFSDKLECKTCQIVYDDPAPNLFSFNSPQGACPACHGFGDLAIYDEDKIVPDKNKTLEEGAIEPCTKPGSLRRLRKLLLEAEKRGIPTDRPFKKLSQEHKDFIFRGEGPYKGVLGFFDRLQRKKYKVQVRVFLARYRKYIPCPDCHQMRLNALALNTKIADFSIGEVVRLTVKDAQGFMDGLSLTPFQKQVAEKLLNEIQARLKFLLEVGLDYITLNRMTFTLSGGEAQRINLASALSTSLVGTLFVLDEPSIGLHARDNHRLVDILKSLKEIGNTVLVVDHDPEIVKAAEYLIDLGPWAGEFGGEVVFSGNMQEFLQTADTLTARYIQGKEKIEVPSVRRKSQHCLTIKNAHKHNLKNIDVRIPLDIFTCVTGVSGSGKSSLLFDVLYKGWQGKAADGFQVIKGKDHVDDIIMVDQSPLSTSLRSIPATYTKAMDEIRTLFSQTREAVVNGYRPGFFSFNTAGGRCEHCKGAGQQIVEMQFLSDVVLTCEACKGKRFKKEILEIKYQDKTINDVLKMSVTEACDFFEKNHRIVKKLCPLKEVGLGYLKLGQPTTTLSGGELQRIKLAHNLVQQRNKKVLYLFDEPTIGLHPHDVAVLLESFQKLVNEGHTVVVIEHNLDMIKCADHIIDLGPEGGDRGGEIVFQGVPEDCISSKLSYTGRYLKSYLSSRTES